MLLQGTAWADAAYQESVQITGGQLVDSLKSIPFMPKSFKQMLDPIVSHVLLHGNQLANVSKASTEIIDLDQETITRIDNDKKTYSVTTFAQMRQLFKDAPKKLEEAQAKMREQQQQPAAANEPPPPKVQVTFEVSVTDPGASKLVNGVMAQEQTMTMKAHVTDLNPPPDSHVQTVTYSVISEIWTAPKPPEMKEIDEFYVRYAKKLMEGVDVAGLMQSMKPVLNGSAIAPLFAKNPGMGPAVQEMTQKMVQESQKIKGTRILEITRMGGEAMVAPGAAAPGATTAGTAPASGSTDAGAAVAGQVATDTATAAAAQQTSKLGAIGSAFGNSLMGAFRHKPPAPATAQPVAATEGSASPSSAVLYETTSQKSDFSGGSVSAAAFQVPTGFTRLESPMVGMAK
jgi:hypothetical protein